MGIPAKTVAKPVAKQVAKNPATFVTNKTQYAQLVKGGLAGIQGQIAKGQRLIKTYESILADMQSAHNWDVFYSHAILACAVSVGIADGFVGALGEFHKGAEKIKIMYDATKPTAELQGKQLAGSATGSDHAKAYVAGVSAIAKGLAGKTGSHALELTVDVNTHVANATISMANQDDDATIAEAKKMGLTGSASVGKLMTQAKSNRIWLGGLALQGFTKVANAYMALTTAGEDIGKAASAFAQDRERQGDFENDKKLMMAKIRDLKTKLAALETVFYQYLEQMAQHQREEVAKRTKGGHAVASKPGHLAAPGKPLAHLVPPRPGMPARPGAARPGHG